MQGLVDDAHAAAAELAQDLVIGRTALAPQVRARRGAGDRLSRTGPVLGEIEGRLRFADDDAKVACWVSSDDTAEPGLGPEDGIDGFHR